MGGRDPPGTSRTQVALPGMRWVDGHKGVFSVELTAVSSVHPQVRSAGVGGTQEAGGGGEALVTALGNIGPRPGTGLGPGPGTWM